MRPVTSIMLTRYRALLLMLLAACRAPAAEFFIAPAGRAEGAGSFEHPWNSLETAAEKAAAGDTIHLRGGAYTSRALKLTFQGEKTRWITIKSWKNEQPRLVGAVELNQCRFVILEGLCMEQSPAGGLIIINSDDLKLERCTIREARGRGLEVIGQDHHPSRIVMNQCRVHDNQGTGIKFGKDLDMGPPLKQFPDPKALDAHLRQINNGGCRDVTISDCDIFRNGKRNGDNLAVSNGERIVIIRNRIHDCPDEDGIDIKQDSDHTTIQDNIIYGNKRVGIFINPVHGERKPPFPGGGHLIIERNLVFNNQAKQMFVRSTEWDNQYCRIENNILSSTDDKSIGLDIARVNNATVCNNTIHGGGLGIHLKNGGHNAFANNIVCATAGTPFTISKGGGTDSTGYDTIENTLQNNNLAPKGTTLIEWNGKGVTSAELRQFEQDTPGCAANRSADPLFTDPRRLNFKLQPNSPCRGAGPESRDIGSLHHPTPTTQPATTGKP